MELFPDGHHVRLRSRVHGTYLYADENAVGVSLRPRRAARASLNAAWAVHLVVRGGDTFVLLHSAATGRYLALSANPAPSGHRGRLAFLTYYDHPGQDDVVWMAVRAGHGAGDDEVLLQHVSSGLLRANGRYLFWHTRVTVDDYANRSTMMHWMVEAIPPRPAPPLLPHPSAGPVERRCIQFVRAHEHGEFHESGWKFFWFDGRSVSQLRVDVAQRVGEENVEDITLCVRAGLHGRLTPLVIDLPWGEAPMDVVVLTTGSPAAEGLRYPDVDAP
ncbi:hypothetical protein ACP70R_020997 [Stipagrostis hirtigluma subsp. patula]